MSTPAPDLADLFAKYNRGADRDRLQDAEQQRSEILRRFPVDAWPMMPLESYALGQTDSEDTFCRWLEFRSQKLGGMRGGSSRKLIVYKHKDKPGWYFPSEYANEQEAWTQVRAGFVQAFACAQRGDWEAIDDIQALRPGSALKVKTLHVYFPSDVLPVYSKAHIQHFLRLLGRPEGDERSDDVIRLNRVLLRTLSAREDLRGWTAQEIMQCLYRAANPREASRIVKIAPGEEGRFWDDCRTGGYICVGWDEVGDLREFESKEAFAASFEELYLGNYKGHRPTLRKKAEELWTLTELEPGDLVVANRGTSRILAVGKVVEPGYEWRPERSEYRNTVRVEWDTSVAKDIEPQKHWAFVTVAPVPATLYQSIARVDGGGAPPAVIDRTFDEIAQALRRKGQVILYGPPGTGKTYIARRFTVWWLLRENRPRDAAAALADAERLLRLEQELTGSSHDVPGQPEVGQLTVLTFHPSYSYEDFIEGFRPVDTGSSGLTLRLEDGIFKRVCRAAAARTDQSFLVLIDEINRANLAKVFGELLTVLERDKRGIQLLLPQSKQRFTIPPNVYVLGTMNTSDRSIKLLDAALRRRFAFVELMPDTTVLRGARVRGLALDDFLDELNHRIAQRQGREKQIGQSFLLDGAQPVADPEEFARLFKQEILPLLQEYCYDDYASLAAYLGTRLVDAEAQTLNEELLADAERLLAALEDEFGPKVSEVP
jgi:5-methylcytosine-specific restriction enzyme B